MRLVYEFTAYTHPRYSQGSTNFSESGSHFEILGAKTMTRIKFLAEEREGRFFAWAPWRLGFVHPCVVNNADWCNLCTPVLYVIADWCNFCTPVLYNNADWCNLCTPVLYNNADWCNWSTLCCTLMLIGAICASLCCTLMLIGAPDSPFVLISSVLYCTPAFSSSRRELRRWILMKLFLKWLLWCVHKNVIFVVGHSFFVPRYVYDLCLHSYLWHLTGYYQTKSWLFTETFLCRFGRENMR
jgi:hypothetical protein